MSDQKHNYDDDFDPSNEQITAQDILEEMRRFLEDQPLTMVPIDIDGRLVLPPKFEFSIDDGVSVVFVPNLTDGAYIFEPFIEVDTNVYEYFLDETFRTQLKGELAKVGFDVTRSFENAEEGHVLVAITFEDEKQYTHKIYLGSKQVGDSGVELEEGETEDRRILIFVDEVPTIIDDENAEGNIGKFLELTRNLSKPITDYLESID